MSITLLRGKFSSAASIIWIRRRTGGTDESGALTLPAARIPYSAATLSQAGTRLSANRRETRRTSPPGGAAAHSRPFRAATRNSPFSWGADRTKNGTGPAAAGGGGGHAGW